MTAKVFLFFTCSNLHYTIKVYLAMLITGEIRILFSVEDAEIEEQAKLFGGACPNGDTVKQAVLIVFLVVMLVSIVL